MRNRFIYGEFLKERPFCRPRKSYMYSAGFDCCLLKNLRIEPRSSVTVDLGFGVRLRKNECAIITLRSSVSAYNLIAAIPPIDYGYEGTVHVFIHNYGDNYYSFVEGDRLCQLIIFKIPRIKGNKIYRGRRGLGSSGRR